MKYFVNDDQRKGTCYHEFYKGKWDGEIFWAPDSIALHDDILYEAVAFTEAISAVFPEYDPSGEIEIDPERWKMIGEKIFQAGDQLALELYGEADKWAQSVFLSYGCFTVLGI